MNNLPALDLAVIAGYFLVLFAIGYWAARREKNVSSDYFLAGRDVGWLAVGASLFAVQELYCRRVSCLRLPFDPIRDFAPVSQLAITPNVLVVNPDKIPAKTVPELIALLKAIADDDPTTIDVLVLPYFVTIGRIGESFVDAYLEPEAHSWIRVVTADRLPISWWAMTAAASILANSPRADSISNSVS